MKTYFKETAVRELIREDEIAKLSAFAERLKQFVAGAQELIDENYRVHGFNEDYKPTLIYDLGASKKYVRIANKDNRSDGLSVYCFVEIATGNVLKSDSWKKPAKQPRSNIFNPDCGLSGVSAYGAKYLLPGGRKGLR